MKITDFFRKPFGRSDTGGEPAIDGGLDGPDIEAYLDFMEGGGEHPVQGQLDSLRFATQTEALAVARANHDPELWVDGKLELEYERGLAHDHEALRDLTSIHAGRWLSEQAAELREAALEVVERRIDLDAANDELAETRVDWQIAARNVRDDPLEIGRFYRSQATGSSLAKLVLCSSSSSPSSS